MTRTPEDRFLDRAIIVLAAVIVVLLFALVLRAV